MVGSESQQPFLDRSQRREVAGGKGVALDDGEGNLHPIAPTVVNDTMRANRSWQFSRSRATHRAPRCEEPLSMIQKTRRAWLYGGGRMTGSTSRSNGGVGSRRDTRRILSPLQDSIHCLGGHRPADESAYV
jgi:hypothetical protein